MNNLLTRFSTDNGTFRLFLGAGAATVAVAFITAQVLVWLTPAGRGDLVQPLPIANAGSATRTYTVTRSVLDDPVTTASIPRPAGMRVDPCGK